jgi:signal transduction histidine kinase
MTALAGGLPRSSVSARELDPIRALCHDLRQPLAAILLLSGSGEGDVTRKMQVILDQAQWLSQLVDTVLCDAAQDEVVEVDVAAVAELAVVRALPTAGCDITVDVLGDTTAWARPVALARAVGCVLDNAIRAAGADGHVAVRVHQERGRVHLTITDDGPGLGKIASRTSLGLTTTRAMVAACNGSFRLRSGSRTGAVADICLHRVGRPIAATEPVAS